MQPDTAARLDLLQVARETLLGEVVPALAGAQRYTTLMIANALRMVERELALCGGIQPVEQSIELVTAKNLIDTSTDAMSLCEVLRKGDLDGNSGLYRALYANVAREVAITRPEVLTADERQQISLS